MGCLQSLEIICKKKRNKGWGSKIKATSHIGLLGIDNIKVVVRLTTKALTGLDAFIR